MLGGLTDSASSVGDPQAVDATRRILILTYSDDRDMDRVVAVLRSRGVGPARWLFDGRDDELQVEVRPGTFELCRGGHCLSSSDLEASAVVVHRVGNGQWDHPVIATAGSDAERRFAEREWSSLFSSLLLEVETRHQHILWVNRPSASVRASRKYFLLATADLDGLRVPSLCISTENLLPQSSSGAYVSKAIDQNEDVDDVRTFASARLPREIIDASPFRTNCPSLIQERVAPDSELRVYYLLGRVLGIRIATRQPYTDIRLVPRESLNVEPVGVPSDLTDAMRRFCARHALSYCVFDFLVASGDYALVDVTPGGSWSYYETPARPFITEWYAKILLEAATGRIVDSSEISRERASSHSAT